jgi:hypothetical protein
MGPAGEWLCFYVNLLVILTGGNVIGAAVCVVSLDLRNHVTEKKILHRQRSVFG